MSTETKEVMDAAIAAHMADEQDGAVPSVYVLLIAGQNVDDLMLTADERGQSRFLFGVANGQTTYATVGLARMLALKWDRFGTFTDDDYDDD